MAPRTKEQQIAYNAKRRGENADKLRGMSEPNAKLGKPPTVLRGGEGFKRERNPKPTKAEVEAKAAKMDKRLKGLLKVNGVSETQATKVVATRRAKLKDGKTALVEALASIKKRVVKPLPPKPLYRDETSLPVADKLRARGAFTPVAQDAAAGSALLLPRSYRRGYKGLGATARGNVLQVTVTMTKDQFAVLKERADMYNCSLAEAVRRCVMAGPLS